MYLTLVILFFGSFGFLIADGAIRDYQQRLSIARFGLRAEGLIIDLEERRQPDAGPDYYPIVRFITQAQQEITAAAPYALSRRKVRYDEWHQLHYLPDEPHRFLLAVQRDDQGHLWIGLLMGAMFEAFWAWSILEHWLGLQ